MKSLLLTTLVMLAGCAQFHEEDEHTFAKQDPCHELAVLVDMSFSFDTKMAEGGAAYKFLLSTIDAYFRNSLGSDDKILIGQLSANRKVLIWQGTPQQLRTEFPSPESFAAFLRTHCDPDGSPIHAGIAKTLEYLLSENCKACLCVLSDMDDNDDRTQPMKERLVRDLQSFANAGGSVGIYYCIDKYVPAWRTILQDSGVKEFRVEGDFNGAPELPLFGE